MDQLSTDLREQLQKHFHKSADVTVRSISSEMAVCFVPELIDKAHLAEFILNPLQCLDKRPTGEQLVDLLPIGEVQSVNSLKEAIPLVARGWVYIATSQGGVAANISSMPKRALVAPQNEATILGPLLAFTEALDTNTALLRSSIPDTALCNEQYPIGNVRETTVSLLYLDSRVEQSCVELLRERIRSLRTNDITGSSELMHMLQDNDASVFPEMMLTERVDMASRSLLEGKIVLIVDGSPLALIGPNEFVDFFLSPEDRYLGWSIGTFLRVLRLLGLMFSVFLTPAYVAALTFHYEIIPSSLLVSLIESRSRVPFPPLFETLILEVTMELLREAGARLPTKVGQTMGIVGGIVIGQAAVQAGFTSNILIMLVALAALGSFAIPDYLMSSSLRLVRYPMIIFAGLWGGVGIAFISLFVTLHLLRQTSLGKAYFTLIHPTERKHDATHELLLPEPHGLTSKGHNLRKLVKSFKFRSLWMGDIEE
ncbi:spore germination protein [Paenibacillus sp. N1-5-1-14]|uniref:spore germination protein n=1 Tax=Paenibacillus radicibacter TaxID=2972488 RepID=UPI0021591CAD|nr:spore germination protein [Paenibacillus radicibacter]MCR8641309.1 spore germination protein [Paenibacillus radicibacter]